MSEPNQPLVKTACDADGVLRIIMARPHVHNAFDEHMIAALTDAFHAAGTDKAARVVILEGEGKSFSAGGDLDWMRRMAQFSDAENLEDSLKLAHLMETIFLCPKPTIAKIHGAAFGGGVGLAAACDMALASDRAVFCLSEVKLGLIPAVISPYVIRAMGERQAKRYFLTAEKMDAATALRIGLVHDVVAHDDLDAAVAKLAETLLANAPNAISEAKALIDAVAGRPLADGAVKRLTAEKIAQLRAKPEARERIRAFLEKN